MQKVTDGTDTTSSCVAVLEIRDQFHRDLTELLHLTEFLLISLKNVISKE